MGRPTLESIFMDLAFQLSSRSTCKRRSVGCVVTSEDFTKVYGIGYNGNYRGGTNGCDSDEVGNCGCLHAEDNCLLKVSERQDVPKVMFVTLMPCITCAKRIINKGGFKEIFFSEIYRDKRGIKLLISQGITCTHMEKIDGQLVKGTSYSKPIPGCFDLWKPRTDTAGLHQIGE